MSRWQDKLRPASFRGVRFFVDNVKKTGGRRGPDHEFPDREDPYAADTGRKQRKFDIDAYILGRDYFAGRNLLIKACEKKGPGRLIHPYYGSQNVVLRDYSADEYVAAGGFVKFQLRFVEAGSLLFPKTNADRSFLVGLAGTLLGDGAASALEDGFKVADEAQFVVDSATDKVLAITETMDGLSAGIVGAADPLAEFAFAIRNIKASASDLVRAPARLASNLRDAFDVFVSAVSPEASFVFHRGFFGFGLTDLPIPQSTATRVNQALSLGSLNSFMQTIGAIGAANAAVGMTHSSFENALGVQNVVGDQLDFLMGSTRDDSVYSSLQGLRSQLVQAVPDEAQNLAHITQFTPFSTLASLPLSYELYGSLDQEQDIIDRNRVRHPGFLVGGRPLEVLGNG